MIALLISAVLAATSVNVMTQVVAAKPGDTIALSGDFTAPVVIQNHTWAPAITIDATGASLNGILFRSINGVNLKGGVYHPAGWSGAVYAISSQNINVSGISTFDTGQYVAVTFRESSNVSLTDARLDRPALGVSLLHAQTATLTNIAIVGQSADGIDVASSHDVTIGYVGCLGSIWDGVHHPDCVQLWSITGEVPTSNVSVRYSIAMGHVQGFTAFDTTAGGFDNITFEHNTVINEYPQAVALYNGRNSRVANNYVAPQPGAQFQSAVNVIGGTEVTVCGNVMEAGGGHVAIHQAACAP